ncbi:t-snare protein [Glarea lozoyensis ATCC 20868]|uniref:T-snare protein n=1 Tax=Glarea lozoyensis (strain ATCC 20868 / MF5171) TaxID=1116229 RepID=S3CM30_GLAL2|nr:t-snare protein [Glarea lozoyensis ATCC 20868]EPE26750.1 t-snare protein [Glarea lozoyensis ATCC 20868]
MSQYANNYGGRQNPYDQRQAASPGYNSPEFRQTHQYGESGAMGGYDESGHNVEMTPLAQAAQQPAVTNNLSQWLDTVVQPLKLEIKDLDTARIPALVRAQQACLTSVDAGRASAKVEADAEAIKDEYKLLIERVKQLKSVRENQNSATRAKHVGELDKGLRASFANYQSMVRDFDRKLREQSTRQYRIVRPDASEQEVRDAIDDPQGPVFTQALMSSDRRGQSQTTLSAVKERNAAIQKIARDMAEIGVLFDDMNNLVMQQEAAIENIETKGEEVVENMDKGTEQIGVAITSARNARKWKWWCLGICILIIAIIVIALVITKPWQAVAPKAARRSLPIQSRRVVSEFTKPIGERIVKVGEDYTPLGKRFRKFQS